MKAIILAGGLGTRLKSVTGEHPKPMAELLGRPLMEHIVELLRENGFCEICCTLRDRAGEIMAHFGDGGRFGVSMQYRIETRPLGTAGSVGGCRDFIGGEDVLVISGDAACDFTLSTLMDEHRARGAAATVALCRSAVPLRYGLAVTDGAGDIRAFIEKPAWPQVVTDLVNTGIYVLSKRAVDAIPAEGAFDFGKDLFPLLLQRGERLAGVALDGATGGPVVTEQLSTSIPGVFACGNVLHVHDLVDYVSEEAGRAGVSAARFVRGETVPGGHLVRLRGENGVRYTVPQSVDLATMPEEVTVRFRVSDRYLDHRLSCYVDGRRVVHKKKRILTPGEMEQLALRREWLSDDTAEVVLCVEEA